MADLSEIYYLVNTSKWCELHLMYAYIVRVVALVVEDLIVLELSSSLAGMMYQTVSPSTI